MLPSENSNHFKSSNQLPNLPTNQLINQPIYQPNNQPTNNPTYIPNNQLTNQLAH